MIERNFVYLSVVLLLSVFVLAWSAFRVWNAERKVRKKWKKLRNDWD